MWLSKAAEVFWKHTKGTISKDSLVQMREVLFRKYDDFYAQSKVLNFAKGFLKYQAKLTFDPRYLAFDMFLEKPRVRKAHKKMTARVVTKDDIEHVLAVIKQRFDVVRSTKNTPGNLQGLCCLGLLLVSAHTARSNS